MIQRIQTLFLLAATGLLFSMFFSDMAYNSSETIKYTNITALLIMLIVTCTISFVTIFLYRHRVIQIRLTILNSLIMLGLQGWVMWLFFSRPEDFAFSITAVFPIVAAILTFTAMRYIARDEAMVRSTSRLR
ncbi:MAG: DUF4293 domain-containing protein [Bacteroidales bacterium]|nr:DUF4293 domain-containing protein [Bacteroidales bacterium]MDD4656106.1 DUF4293 domain-containing protein [Bacteroidales bacterium]